MDTEQLLQLIRSELVEDHNFKSDLVATIILVLIVAGMRMMLAKLVRRIENVPETRKLRWTVQVRWSAYLTLIVGLVVIWATEIRTMSVTLMAIAVAIVLATKELILCVQGAVLRATAKAFAVGDRIEIDGIRGDVIDHGLLATTIVEVGPGQQRTGRAITLPNSYLINNAVINETFTEAYVLHVIEIPLSRTMDWRKVEKQVLSVAQDICEEFLSEARKYMYASARFHGLTVPFVEPRVTLQLKGPDDLVLLLRVPTPAREKGRTEQRILRKLLSDPALFAAGSTKVNASAH